MKTISVENQQVNIYNIHDFPYNLFKNRSTVERNSRSTKRYADFICTFDIETTSIKVEECSIFKSDFGFMYVWQFCADGIVVMGRTWEEYKYFIEKLAETVECVFRRIVVYVHNLAFEFQFFRDFFKIKDVFSRNKRDVVYCTTDTIEYRCSYILSNMGLAKFLQKTKGVTFQKQDGKDFDYSIKRYPDTPLTDEELGYCVCDVLGLWQALKVYMLEDTLATIPITSTGYVRRDFKKVCLETDGYKRQMFKTSLNATTYMLCREASRGAISGSNHIHTDEILEDIDSEDIKSSYPFQMATKYFPQSRFVRYNAKYDSEKWHKILNNFCCIIVWSCENFKLKRWKSIPYVSKAKCRAIKGAKCGNGKVYMAEKIGMCCTEIDFRIIAEQYSFTNVQIYEVWGAYRGMLAKPFRELLMHMFQMKTDLEDGDPFLYNKYKNKINAAFGMMLTDILHPEIKYVAGSNEPWKIEEIKDIDKALKDYYRSYSSFLSYQHGVWVLAHGRDSLVEGMNVVGNDIVQVDTDSVKHHEDYSEEFSMINQRIIDNAESFDIKPYSMKNGHKHYLGVWEHEGKQGEFTYKTFKTLGAKKYAYTDSSDKMHITVSGLKKDADEYLEKEGGLNAFRCGRIVPSTDSGRTASCYCDFDKIYTIRLNGHLITLGSNVAVTNVSYTLGMANEWLMMVLDGVIEKQAEMNFNGAFEKYHV